MTEWLRDSPLTQTLSPQAGRGRRIPLAPHERGEGGARVSGRVRGTVRVSANG